MFRLKFRAAPRFSRTPTQLAWVQATRRPFLLPLLALFLIACGDLVSEPQAAGELETAAENEEALPPPTAAAPDLGASATPLPPATAVPTETILPPTPQLQPEKTHVVAVGETLSRISELHGVSSAAIQRANKIGDPNLIQAGQLLIIPPGDSTQVQSTADTGNGAALSTSRGGSDLDESVSPTDGDQRAAELPNGVPCPAPEEIVVPEGAATIGRSALCSIPILSYQIGSGPKQVILVAGIHGGYEWNTTLLAYALLDFLITNPDQLPSSITVHLIPNANPDGLYMVTQKTGLFTLGDIAADTTPGRFNGSEVDLNRNWDCGWSHEAYWRNERVFAGFGALSEPETRALLSFIEPRSPEVVLFWHSAANQVIPGGCGAPGPRGSELATVFAGAANYPFALEFVGAYEVTGDAGDALALRDIASFTVEMTNHQSLDFEQNRDGLLALLRYLDTNGEGSS